jgi:2-isopropylmalate synthase
VSSATGQPPRAAVAVKLVDADVASGLHKQAGDVVTAEETGDGMVDAACGAIRRAVGRDGVSLVSFQVSAVTGGIDALGEVTVTVEVEDGQRYTGRGVSTDIVDASARAYLDALNRSRRLVQRSEEFRP